MLSFKYSSLVVVGFLAISSLVACSKDSDSRSAGFIEYSGQFTAKNNEIKTQSTSDSEISRLLGCNEVSTLTRLDKNVFSVSMQVSSYSQDLYDAPLVQEAYQADYRTSTGGAVYERSYAALGTSVNGVGVVAAGAYSFTDSCSQSSGCDIQKRVFTKGSAWDMVKASGEYRKAINLAKQNSGNMSCNFVADPENPNVDTIVQEGTYSVGGASYGAVLVTTKKNVNVSCMGMKVTKAVTTKKEIILSDLMPVSEDFSVSKIGERNLSCARTRVFAGEVTQSADVTFAGRNTQLNTYNITGKILSKDQWNQNQSEYASTLARLEQAVALAQSRRNEAQTRLTSARAAVSEALAQATNARSEADKVNREAQVIANDPKSSKDQIESARQRAEAANNYANQKQTVYEQSRDYARQAEIASSQADQNLIQAREDLRKFKESSN